MIQLAQGEAGRHPQDGIANPVVPVFNHSNWSSEIRNLVDEVLEQERRLHSYPVATGQHAKHHFESHQLRYETETRTQELRIREGNGQVNLFTRGYVQLESQPSELEKMTTFTSALTGADTTVKTKVTYGAYSVDEVVKRLRDRLKAVDLEEGTSYARSTRPMCFGK